jgi:hypothetical protein
MSPSKQKLLDLEKTGLYVFHGSGYDCTVLEPRQAYNYIKGKQVPDGKPAIYATSIADFAIFFAIINSINCPQDGRASVNTRELENGDTAVTFDTTQASIDQLTDASSGFVYVFEKTAFKRRNKGGVEYVFHMPAKPISKISVTRRDLPEKIGIIEP